MYINGKGAKSWFKLNISVLLPANTGLEDLSLTIQGPTILGILGPNGAGKSTPIKAMLGLLPHAGKGPARSKDLSQVLQRVAYVEQKSAIDFHFPITVRVHLTGSLSPPFYLQEKKQRRSPKSGKCLETCQSSWSSGSPDRPAFRRAIPTGADRPLLGPRSGCHFLDEPFAGLTLSAKTSSCRPSRPWNKKARPFWSSITTSARSQLISTRSSSFIVNWLHLGKREETFTKENLHAAYGHELFMEVGSDDYRIYRWITAIPLLTECPDHSHRHRDCRWAVGCFIILRGMSLMGDAISHAVLPGVALSLYPRHQFLYWRYCLWPPGVRPYHLYQEQLHHQERHCNWDYLFLLSLALRVILIGVAKSSTDLSTSSLGISLAVQDRDMWITIGGRVRSCWWLSLFRPYCSHLLILFCSIHGRPGQGPITTSLWCSWPWFLSLLCRVSEPFSSSPCYYTPLRRPISIPIVWSMMLFHRIRCSCIHPGTLYWL